MWSVQNLGSEAILIYNLPPLERPESSENVHC